MDAASSAPGVMAQALGMTSMIYAFQFAQQAKPKSEIVPLAELNEHLLRLHAAKALIISVSTIPPRDNTTLVLIAYYATEGK